MEGLRCCPALHGLEEKGLRDDMATVERMLVEIFHGEDRAEFTAI